MRKNIDMIASYFIYLNNEQSLDTTSLLSPHSTAVTVVTIDVNFINVWWTGELSNKVMKWLAK